MIYRMVENKMPPFRPPFAGKKSAVPLAVRRSAVVPMRGD